MRNNAGQLIGTTAFKTVRTGGGGYVITGSQSNDGLTIAVGMDVFNAYARRSGDTSWTPLFVPDSLSASEYDPRPANGAFIDNLGSMAAIVAPSSKDRIYAAWNGYFYKFDWNGTKWVGTRCNLTAKQMLSNSGTSRFWADKIAVHPINPDIAIFGTFNDGVYYTTDAGATMTAIAGIPATVNDVGGHPCPYLVAIDPSNASNVYIAVQGTGIYRSTTGVSGTFALLSGSLATRYSQVLVDQNGVVWACDSDGATGSNVHKYSAGAWSVPAIGVLAQTIAVDPLNALRIVALSGDDARAYATDGATFATGTATKKLSSTDIPWLDQGTMFPSKAFFDHVVSGKLWCPNGLGVAYCTAGTWDWTDYSAGIEELVANYALSIPGKPATLFGCWDKPIWYRDSLDSFPDFHLGTTSTAIDAGWQFDYAADDPNFVGVASGFASDTSGFSTDAGRTWSDWFPGGYPVGAGGAGGAIAINRKTNIIVVPGNNGAAVYTKDGSTWSTLNVGGVTANWVSADYVRRQLVTADKTRAGVFAIVMKSTQGTGVQGLWVTANGGDSWTKNVAGRLDSTGDPSDFWYCTLAYIPGKPGELLYTSGATFASRLLWFTGDGLTTAKVDVGAAWGLTNVTKFAFGKALDGQSYPAVYFYGTLSGVTGLYRSVDFFATTPQLLSKFPMNLDILSALEGDKNIFGRVYMGGNGSGWRYCDYGLGMTLS